MSIFDFVTEDEERRNKLAESAQEVFHALGPLGTPAVPELSRILRSAGIIPGYRALHALDYIGEPSLPAIISTARLTNSASRFLAIRSLWAHTNSPEAPKFLTEATADCDPHVREDAADIGHRADRTR